MKKRILSMLLALIMALSLVPVTAFAAATLEGRLADARAMTSRYVDLMNALFMDVNPIPVKAALNMMGFDCGRCRLPLTDMSAPMLGKLRAALGEHVKLA